MHGDKRTLAHMWPLLEDIGMWGNWDMWTWEHKDIGPRGHYMRTWGRGDIRTQGNNDTGTWGHRDTWP